MKRTFHLVLTIVITFLCMTGCNKAPSVDKSVHPEEIFSYYKTLTDQYGTSISEVLENLNIDPQTVVNNGSAVFGTPWKEEYAEITFDIGLNFGTGEQLSGVCYKSFYTYPEDENQFLLDTVTVCEQLISDFGEKFDDTYTFNWVEVYLKEDWDRGIRYWEDISVLKRLLDEGYNGALLIWKTVTVSMYTDLEQGMSYIEISY